MKNVLFMLTSLVLHLSVKGQDTESKANISVSGYVETYYLYDFNEPEDNNRHPFIYSYHRHNEVNVNLAFLKGSYNTDDVRANLAFMTGTYANANLSSEPGVLKNIFEANAGVKLSSARNLWLDAGIFASHIGFESAIGKDSWTLTRSLLADNTPYFESGAKVSYASERGEWFFSILLLNGWQRIQRIVGNSLPSVGTQVTFKPTPDIIVNSSLFVGTDTPDSARLMRYFHNFYGTFRLSEKIGLIFGFDYGIQQKSPHSSLYSHWLSPVVITRIALSEAASMDVRAEYYEDKERVIIKAGSSDAFRITGLSTNFDFKFSPNAVWRVELRNFNSARPIFVRGNRTVKNNTFITTALAVSF